MIVFCRNGAVEEMQKRFSGSSILTQDVDRLRYFYRNALNTGLPILVAPEAVEGIREGDELTVDLATGEIVDVTAGVTYQAQPLPPFMRELVEAGGLLPYLKTKGAS